MFPPWRELKDAEITILTRQRADEPIPDLVWDRIRELFDMCRQATDAEAAICFHGVRALLAERDGDISRAIKHRMIEIEKIERLHEEEKRNPTGGYALQNYGASDLEFRRQIVEELEANH